MNCFLTSTEMTLLPDALHGMKWERSLRIFIAKTISSSAAVNIRWVEALKKARDGRGISVMMRHNTSFSEADDWMVRRLLTN